MKRDPNLFEAFQDVARTPPQSRPAPTAARGRGGAKRELPPRLVAVVGGGLVLMFFAGYFLGGQREEVAAKDVAIARGHARSSWQPAGPASSRGVALGSERPPARFEEIEPGLKNTVSNLSDLYNTKNLYTVLAITYSDVPSLQGRARDIAKFLRQHDLPAYEPISRSGNIEVLVGAAETRGALQELTAKLRGTRGPTGRNFDFQSAFVVNIDDHLDRD